MRKGIGLMLIAFVVGMLLCFSAAKGGNSNP